MNVLFVNSNTIMLFLEIMLSQEYNSHVCGHQRFSVFLKYWRRVPRKQILYLKDWHFHRETKHYYSAYTTPPLFGSDWLNEWWESRKVSADVATMIWCNPNFDLGPEQRLQICLHWPERLVDSSACGCFWFFQVTWNKKCLDCQRFLLTNPLQKSETSPFQKYIVQKLDSFQCLSF